jgi:hypothetical protein
MLYPSYIYTDEYGDFEKLVKMNGSAGAIDGDRRSGAVCIHAPLQIPAQPANGGAAVKYQVAAAAASTASRSV